MKDKAETVNRTIAPLRNVAQMTALCERVMNRSRGLPGMATYHGFSGYGKSTAAIYAANVYDAVVVQVKSAWTQKKLCQVVIESLGIKAARTTADMVDQIGQELSTSGRPLIVDEADFLVQKKMIEIVRDIHESGAPAVILIGEEHLPSKLRPWERVHGRMLDWVAAEPCSLDDCRHLVKLYCRGVEVADDLLQQIHQAAAGSTRRVCVNLDQVRELAATRALKRVAASDWGDRALFRGLPPSARRAA